MVEMMVMVVVVVVVEGVSVEGGWVKSCSTTSQRLLTPNRMMGKLESRCHLGHALQGSG